jgi:hypothetical protein
VNAIIAVILVIAALSAVSVPYFMRRRKRRLAIEALEKKKADSADLLSKARSIIGDCEIAYGYLSERVSAPELEDFSDALDAVRDDVRRATEAFASASKTAGADWDLVRGDIISVKVLAEACEKKKESAALLESTAREKFKDLADEIERAETALSREKAFGFKIPSIEAELTQAKAKFRLIRDRDYAKHELGKTIRGCGMESERLWLRVMSQLGHERFLERESGLHEELRRLRERAEDAVKTHGSLKGDFLLKIAERTGTIEVEGTLARAMAFLMECDIVLIGCQEFLINHDLEAVGGLMKQAEAMLDEVCRELDTLVRFRNPRLPTGPTVPKGGPDASGRHDGPCTVH